MNNWDDQIVKWVRRYRFHFGIATLIAVRCFHLGSEIDSPHDWRQCDTAYYIRDFYRNGIDLLHPAVCWMGASDTVALEFPLPEAIVAFFYHITGESIPIARLVFIWFFIGAVLYFYKIVRLVFDPLIAKWSILVYLALPLSMYYSRAIHIDFFVVFLTHAMAYYYLKGVLERRWGYILLSSIVTSLACMIKIPYVLIWAFPLGYYTFLQKSRQWVMRWLALYLIPLTAFICWQKHGFYINNHAPDLNYILGYHKMLPSAGWYFGTINQRLSLYSWWVLLNRGLFEVVGIGGLICFIASVFFYKSSKPFIFLIYWFVGLIVYVMIFFNLNLVHNYYQIPFLAPIALFLALGMKRIQDYYPKLNLMLCPMLILLNIGYTEKNYFKTAEDEIEIAELIRQHTPDDALIAVTYDKMDCRNPKILFRSDRRGWSIEELALNPTVIDRLHKDQGAHFWAFAGKLPGIEMSGFLSSLAKPQIFPLKATDANLFLYNLEEH